MIHAIIIEDEPLAAERLQCQIGEVTPLIEVKRILHTVEDAIAYLQLNVPELIFLDINLFDRYSFEIFESVEVRSRIVFTTAYSEFAIKAFEQNSIDYLLKPISKEALNKSIQKFFSLKRDEGSSGKMTPNGAFSFREKFLVRQGTQFFIILTSDVSYFYAEDKCTFITTRNGKRYIYEASLNEIETTLNPRQFFRINRKYIVQIESIRSITYLSKSRLKVTIEPPPSPIEIITVAREKMGSFRRWLAH